MKRVLALAASLTLVASPAVAQEHAMGEGHTDPVTSVFTLQQRFIDWIIAAADQAPAADYSFKPTPAVRSLGQLFGHVANANYDFCAAVKGEKNPNSTDFEKASRSAIIAGLRAAKSYCEGAATFGAAHHHDAREMYGGKGDVTWLVAFNLSHTAEHYGNIVTYLRLKGMTPPSSQRN